ncbi:hypothetical protein NY537_11245 [Curtobacterium flaccumfaciens pv. betae]|nr:hypothetical protein [Curtobacterium flaccumfaciens]MCS0471205.1 hypothetical protein [Curtobacterium flaccumfaciens pv. betae]MCS0477665.1 hypothetical protein [Curtobacterium flaccumfaciens pv. betae]MCS0482829.1 hypothetical protein [Curtobacterium flaccumfaciens pv. betae]MCS0484905.1 hypothetical protein [Curtobacterium flaccumfaciens pv. betae]MCS0488645.1 hypothetical protein [Curtobacterium flaccumfaciens pv. betae]
MTAPNTNAGTPGAKCVAVPVVPQTAAATAIAARPPTGLEARPAPGP